MYELWRCGTDGADELADAQDWTPPNTCHTQNTEIQKILLLKERRNKWMPHQIPATHKIQKSNKYFGLSLERRNKWMHYQIPSKDKIRNPKGNFAKVWKKRNKWMPHQRWYVKHLPYTKKRTKKFTVIKVSKRKING